MAQRYDFAKLKLLAYDEYTGVERRLMVFMFRVMDCNIREHHFSTEKDVLAAAENALDTSVLSSYNTGFAQEKSLSLAGLPKRSYRERQSYSNNTLQKRRKES